MSLIHGMISTSTRLAQLFTYYLTIPLSKRKEQFTPSSNSILPCHRPPHPQPQTQVPIGHNAELRLRWVEDVQGNGLPSRRLSSSQGVQGMVVKDAHIYHEIYQCTMFFGVETLESIECNVWTTCRDKHLHDMWRRLCLFFYSKVGGIELVSSSGSSISFKTKFIHLPNHNPLSSPKVGGDSRAMKSFPAAQQKATNMLVQQLSVTHLLRQWDNMCFNHTSCGNVKKQVSQWLHYGWYI